MEIAERLPNTAYVPILKAKLGELGALGSDSNPRLVPLVQFEPQAKSVKLLASGWSVGHVRWLQPVNLQAAPAAKFAAQVSSVFQELSSMGQLGVPVTTPSDSAATATALIRAERTNDCGFVFRVDAEDLLDRASARDLLHQMLSRFSSTESSVDLLVDCGLVSGSPVVLATIAGQALDNVPELAKWRNVVVSFSAFPKSLASFARASHNVIPRDDAFAYKLLLSASTYGRVIVFSDYAVGVPALATPAYRGIPSIKYCAGNAWHIYRGDSLQDPSQQYARMAASLAAGRHMGAAAFSAGDKYLRDVVAGVDGPGNATTYVRVATSRHLAVVLHRLATIGEP